MDISFYISALLIGIGGSLHCVGMCGPLMMSTWMMDESKNLQLKNWIVYHAGRLSVYMVWGIVFGTIGSSIRWFGWQQNIAISLGIGMLLMLVLTKLIPSFDTLLSKNPISQYLRKHLAPWIYKNNSSSSLAAGVLNGILPCGLVYVALAGATAVQDIWKGGLFMLTFGIGTLPALTVVALFSKRIPFNWRIKLEKAYPILIGLMAIMLIVRGLNLGEMYSPALTPQPGKMANCLPK